VRIGYIQYLRDKFFTKLQNNNNNNNNRKVETLRERDHWGDPGVNGRIILRRIFRKWDVDWAGSG
jgi:hypothetical protein